MIRFCSSLIICLVGIFVLIFSVGGLPSFYLDIGSFLIIGLFPLVFLGVLFGFKEMVLSFSVLMKKEPEKDKLIKALTFSKYMAKQFLFWDLLWHLLKLRRC
jgi:hypothetical protein